MCSGVVFLYNSNTVIIISLTSKRSEQGVFSRMSTGASVSRSQLLHQELHFLVLKFM